jgi:hypothetical protein
MKIKEVILVVESSEPKTHKSFQLHEYDTDSLKRCIRSRQREIANIFNDFPEIVHEDLNHESFDLQGLLAMLMESEQVRCVIPNEALDKGWSFKHNVDMPTGYSKGEGLKKEMVEEITIE